jgi:hypothetical protein
VTVVKRSTNYSRQEEEHVRTCKLCLAERALVSA